MSSVTDTNAKMLFDEDGDFVRYDLPETAPLSIRHKFVDRPGPNGRFDVVDELVYVVEWPGGIWAEMFTCPRGCEHLVRGFVGQPNIARLQMAVEAKGRDADAAIARIADDLEAEAEREGVAA